jgi:hypothetical protein
VVIAYRRYADSYGIAVVGTVSGTSISFGTPVVFYTSTTNEISMCYDSSAGRVVITYLLGSTYGALVVGTVSGTAISFGASITFHPYAVTYHKACYDVTSGKVVVSLRDGPSTWGSAVVITHGATPATPDNILGIVQGGVANGQICTIGSIGYVDEQQSGLTPGRRYYIDGAGGFTLTNTGRYLGKAIAATKLLIGG